MAMKIELRKESWPTIYNFDIDEDGDGVGIDENQLVQVELAFENFRRTQRKLRRLYEIQTSLKRGS